MNAAQGHYVWSGLSLPRTLAWAALVLAVALPLAALPLPYAAALLVGTAVVVWSVARPELALYLLAFSVPYESLRELSVGGVALGSTELLVALLAVAWSLRLATDRERPSLRPAVALALLPMLAAVLLATLRATELGAAFKEALRWLELLLVFLAANYLLRAPRQRATMLAALLLAGVSEALLGLAQFVLRWGPESFLTGSFLRAYGTFGQPNPYAGYLGTLLPLALALALVGWFDPAAKKRAWYWALVAALLLLVAAFLASQSRGALLGFAAALAVVGGLLSRRAMLAVLGLACAGVLLLLLGTFDLLPAAVAERLTQITSYFGVFDVRTVVLTPANWAVVERMAVWQAAWGEFEAFPLLGVGAGNYVSAYPAFAMPGWTDAMGHAHNLYLNLLAEMGAVGLASFLVFWLGSLAAVFRAWRTGGAGLSWWQRALPLGVLGVLAQMTTHNFFDNLLVHGLNVQLALLLALAVWPGEAKGKAVPNC